MMYSSTFISPEENNWKYKSRFYSKTEDLENVDLLSRYGNDSSSIADVKGMINLEKRIHGFLGTLIADDEKLTVAVVDKKSNKSQFISKKKDIRVHRLYQPFLYSLYEKSKSLSLFDASTQTYDYGTCLKPLWKTHTKFKNTMIDKKKQTFGLESYNKNYDANDLRFSRYLRIKQEPETY